MPWKVIEYIYIGKLCLTFYYNKHGVDFAELEYIRISNENKNIEPKQWWIRDIRENMHMNTDINTMRTVI